MLRPQRERKQTFKALQSASNARSISQIVDSKKRKLHTFQPVPAEQVAEPRILNHPLPHYQPPINLHLFHSRPRLRPQSPIEAFRLFITHDIVDIIVANTNTYADNHRDATTPSDLHSRVWRATTNPEIWRYFGCLFCMGLELLNTPDDRPVQVPVPYPRWRPLPRPTKCVWCCEHQGSAGPQARCWPR